ncbi:MAG TPA: DUF1573 domain-containing protein [Candidatus Krumholzibacteria bacterium]|nr:DUF1573 domain-containing protein [Candidatus Krumholzibacteria bacterium]
MRISATLLGAIAFAVGAAVLAGSPETAEAQKPSIEIPRMRQDFGDVFERAQYEYAFVVRNRGDADLVIEDVKPGCGCTVAKFDKLIKPGQEGKIELVLDGGRVHGEFSKTASVKTNDPDHPELTLTIAGNEIPFLRVEPEGTIYLHGRYDEKVEKSVTLASNEKDFALAIKKVSSNIDDKIAYSVEPGPEKGVFTLHVEKKLDVPPSSAYGNITIETNSENSPETVLQVHVLSKGAISVTPATVNFGVVKFAARGEAADPLSKSVIVLKTDGEFQIKDLIIDNKNFSAKYETMEAGKQYKVEITFVPPSKVQTSQREVGELLINTTDPKEPAVRVHLLARAM